MSTQVVNQMLRTQRQQKAAAHHGIRNGKDVAVLNATDLQTISQILRADNDATSSEAAATLPSMSEAAIARRKRMEAIDADRKTAGTRRDHFEEEEDVRREQIKARAARMRLEETDEVKAMNAIINAAKIGAIRDAQVAQKSAILEERAAAEQAAEEAIEMERVRALRLYEERETSRATARRRGAAVLRQQIAEVELLRRRDLESKAAEQALLVRAMERTRADEKEAAEARRRTAKLLQMEVAQANLRSQAAKVAAVEMEKEEDKRVRRWVEEKEARDLAIAADEKRLAQAKEREVARLRGQQQRVLDTRAQMDELRARRHQDERARDARLKDAADAKRRADMNSELERSRAEQLALKSALRAAAREEEEAESARARAMQDEVAVLDRQRHVLESLQKRKQATALQGQIEERRSAMRNERISELEATKRAMEEDELRAAALEELRREKIAELHALDVPDQYKSKILTLKASSRGLGGL